jgi:ABC-type Zn2+ transport system substrate-binding protein/surface adhesin
MSVSLLFKLEVSTGKPFLVLHEVNVYFTERFGVNVEGLRENLTVIQIHYP